MSKTTTMLRDEAKKLMSSGAVDYFIGYEQGSVPFRTTPLFAKEERALEKLVWNPFCHNTLPTYLFLNRYQGLLKYEGKKVGLVVKGCDSRSVLRILNDRLFAREDVVIFGVTCYGTVDPEKLVPLVSISSPNDVTVEPDKVIIKTPEGNTKELKREEVLNEKCLTCTTNIPVIYDQLIGEPAETGFSQAAAAMESGKDAATEARYAKVAEMEAMSVEERSDFWNRQSARCIRCYACRNTCPACNCRSCVFEQQDTKWTGKGVNVSDDHFFHLTRAFHVAGRCVDCGECERVCPVGIPVQKLNRKIQKDMEDLFEEKIIASEEEIEKAPPLGGFLKEDPEEFL